LGNRGGTDDSASSASLPVYQFTGLPVVSHKPNHENTTDIVKSVRAPPGTRRAGAGRGRRTGRALTGARAFPAGGARSAVRPRSSPGRAGRRDLPRRRLYSDLREPEGAAVAIA
jgi:hypothetical protein